MGDWTRLRILHLALIAGLLPTGVGLVIARSGDSPPAAVAPSPTTSPTQTPTGGGPGAPQVAFARLGPDQFLHDVRAARPDGSALGPLAGAVGTDRQISGAGLVVYSKPLPSEGGFVAAGIAIAGIDGSHERLLTDGGYDTQPSFSPDGSEIMYLRLVKIGTDEPFSEVVFMTALGKPIRFLRPPKNYTYSWPAWSPDGRRVAVVRSSPFKVSEASKRIFLLPLDGSEPRSLIVGDYGHLAWSHDGTRIAAVRDRKQGTKPGAHTTGQDVWVIPANGSRPANVTNLAPSRERSIVFCGASGSPFGQIMQPAWSPDDKQIAFLSSYRHVPQFARAYDVAVVASTGSAARFAYRSAVVVCLSQSASGSKESTPEQLVLLGWV